MCWARTINKSQSESGGCGYCYFCCIVEFRSHRTEYLTDLFANKMESIRRFNNKKINSTHSTESRTVNICLLFSAHTACHVHEFSVKFCLFIFVDDLGQMQTAVLSIWGQYVLCIEFWIFCIDRWNVRMHQFLAVDTNALNFSVVTRNQRNCCTHKVLKRYSQYICRYL